MSSSSFGAAVAASCLCLSACATPPRVSLDPPPAKDAPSSTRAAWYRAHRPVHVVPASVAVGTYARARTFAILEDGTRVDVPADLLPTVEPSSPTARAAARAADERAAADMWNVVGWSTYGVGIAVMFGSLVPVAVAAPVADGGDLPPEAGVALAILTTGALVAGVGIVPIWLAMDANARALREEETAFLTYDRSLRERLDLVDVVAPPPVVAGGARDPTDEGAP